MNSEERLVEQKTIEVVPNASGAQDDRFQRIFWAGTGTMRLAYRDAQVMEAVVIREAGWLHVWVAPE